LNQNGVVTTIPFDIKARAHQAMLEAGFQPDFPAEVAREVQALNQGALKNALPAVRDLRSLLWSSIDNDSSRDLDQVEYVDKLPDGTVRLLVGIADVDASVPKGSATDHHAAVESTSVYTGVATFPMLPAELSTDLTSLLDAQDRLSIIIELHILDSGDVKAHDVYPAWLCNRAKLAYSSTGAWLEGRAPIPPAVADVPGMEAQLRLQLETSESLRGIRKLHGALTFESVETTPVLQNGEVNRDNSRRFESKRGSRIPGCVSTHQRGQPFSPNRQSPQRFRRRCCGRAAIRLGRLEESWARRRNVPAAAGRAPARRAR
jgi:exoribonuclease-2